MGSSGSMISNTVFAATALMLLSGVLARAQAAPVALNQKTDYQSPYTVQFSFELNDLIGDILNGPRGDFMRESAAPFGDWNSPRIRHLYGAWGPPARRYPPPEGVDQKSAAWKRERVIATALRYQGCPYQYHHIPDWDPPRDWPWLKTGSGHNSRGLDCSNFTSFVYSLALGIRPESGIRQQSEHLEVSIPATGRTVRAVRIERPASYASLNKVLRTGDLVFVRSRAGNVSHVVLWVGAIGRSPDGTPLVIDSTGSGTRDSQGRSIPDGVHLRPFRENSWYYQSMSHAFRIIPDDTARVLNL